MSHLFMQNFRLALPLAFALALTACSAPSAGTGSAPGLARASQAARARAAEPFAGLMVKVLSWSNDYSEANTFRGVIYAGGPGFDLAIGFTQRGSGYTVNYVSNEAKGGGAASQAGSLPAGGRATVPASAYPALGRALEAAASHVGNRSDREACAGTAAALQHPTP